MTKRIIKSRTLVALVLDESPSMSGLLSQAGQTFNGFLDSFRKPVKFVETLVTVIAFNEEVNVVTPVSPVATVPVIVPRARGRGTALFDAVGVAIDSLKAFPAKPNDAYLVLVVTDGEENSSREYNSTSLSRIFQQEQASGKWTFAFNVPQGRTFTLSRMGIPSENVREWEISVRGMQDTGIHTQSAVASFQATRGAGGMSVNSFYAPVTTDVADLKAKQVHAKLDDLSDRFKVLSVEKESTVQPFVESKTKKPYVVGSAYYLLMKPEKVQPTKRVLIMEKGKHAIWGGKAARDLIGLPDGPAKVTPGNHASYDIYVQSASVNRKLPRGTRVLVDLTQKVGVKPTWDHTAAPAVKN